MVATMLAHGGALGAAFEMGFIVVPILAFVILSRISKRRLDAEDGEGDDAEDAADTGQTDDGAGPSQ